MPDLGVMESVSVLIGVVSAMLTAVVGLLAYQLSQVSSRNAAERAIGDLANSLANYRAEHPQMLSLARSWSHSDWARLYSDEPESERVVLYYSYVDIGLELCNTVLKARSGRRISRRVYEDHYLPLVRYFLVENYLIIQGMLDAPYLSNLVRRELDEGLGARWKLLHGRLVADESSGAVVAASEGADVTASAPIS